MAHEEAAKSFAMTERERVLRLAAEQQLALITNMQAKDMDVVAALEEKNRCGSTWPKSTGYFFIRSHWLVLWVVPESDC